MSPSPADPARRTPAASRVVMTELVLPADTNNYGHIFGGRLLALADKCSAMAAMRHCRLPVVTASFDRVDFLRPVKAGMMVILTAELTAAFTTSMEVAVTVEAEDPVSAVRVRTCRALITVVAIDPTGRPSPVPPLELETPEERARAERAAKRREHRVRTRDEF
ncbi:MAG: acyl-CoA thioesterase [Acidobacteria bacterium]|nr:acyl-CoA thioesterase [Acidobacteriota bacterium]